MSDVLRIAIPLTVYSIVMFFVSFFMATKLGQTTRDRIQPPHPKDSQPYLPRGSPEKPGDLQTVPNRQFAAHAPAN